jgi:predicted CXXCH cytochrome family protein
MACSSCHDPHQTKQEHFLRASKDQLCGTCHGRELQSLAGSHDLTRSPNLLNALGRPATDTGKCGFCHSIHEGGGEVMWAATKQAPTKPDDLCVSCHQAGGLASNKPAPLLSHPTGPAVTPKTKLTSMSAAGANLPLFDREGHRAETGFMACSSCHDPHADAARTRSLLRVNGPPSATCVQCHGEKGQLAGSPHDGRTKPAAWPTTAPSSAKGANASAATAGEADLCMSCHRAHGKDPAGGLWAVPPSLTASKQASAADRVCLACHK